MQLCLGPSVFYSMVLKAIRCPVAHRQRLSDTFPQLLLCKNTLLRNPLFIFLGFFFCFQDIVIGTPGRMKDLIEMGVCNLHEVSFVVSQLCFSLCCSCCLTVWVYGWHTIYVLFSHKYGGVLDINRLTQLQLQTIFLCSFVFHILNLWVGYMKAVSLVF